MRYAIIDITNRPEPAFDEDGEPVLFAPEGPVTNIAVSDDAEFAASQEWIACDESVQIGWHYNGSDFAPLLAPLVERKAAKRAAINAEKLRRQNGVAPTPAGPVDCDTDSRNKLNGAVLMAMLAAQAQQPFAINWTLADNSNVLLDGAGMIALASAVGSYVAACHAHAQTLKAAVEISVDHAELDAIDIMTGWP